jgi:hypothetical protein
MADRGSWVGTPGNFCPLPMIVAVTTARAPAGQKDGWAQTTSRRSTQFRKAKSLSGWASVQVAFTALLGSSATPDQIGRLDHAYLGGRIHIGQKATNGPG